MTIRFKSLHEAEKAFAEDRAMLAQVGGIIFEPGRTYLPEAFKHNVQLAMDAQPSMSTNVNSAVPNWMTQYVDPEITEILFAPNVAAEIMGEVKKGDWTTQTAIFSLVEHEGEVSSYGDYNENGHTGVNTNWPQRQAYLYQTIKEYGELELDRAGLAKLNWVTEIDRAAALALSKFQNLCYFFGVTGLQNYGLLNDPNLSGALTPATKAYGGNKWVNNGAIVATANEVYADIQALFLQIVSQASGLVDQKAKMKLCMSPQSSVALTATNSFNVNVNDLLKKNFPSIEIETAMQYGVLSASNPQGIAGGNLVQLIVESVEGQKTGFCGFNEKQRAHPIIRGLSSFKQKLTAGTWGTVIRQPFAISSMLGV